jgi:predicted ABC-type exoprotein transport system permease subunit
MINRVLTKPIYQKLVANITAFFTTHCLILLILVGITLVLLQKSQQLPSITGEALLP